MPKDKKIKQRAQALKEAEELAKAEALKNKQQQPTQPEQQPPTTNDAEQANDADIPLSDAIEVEPTSEHRQLLTKDHSIQSAPNVNSAGKPINPFGTKGLYTDEICLTVEKLASEGLTDKQIAESIGLGIRTFYEWKHKHPHFSQALNKYRGLANMYVENALMRSALGYDYTEEQVSKDGFPVEIRKHITGSVAAQKYYLNNRMPERYKNKVEQVLSLQQDIQTVAIVIKRREG